MPKCPEGFSYCSRCNAGKTNEHAPGHRPGDARKISLQLSVEEVDLIRRALRETRERARKNELRLIEKFGKKADVNRAMDLQRVSRTLQARISVLCGSEPKEKRVPDWPPGRYVHVETGEIILASSCARACGCYGARVKTVGQDVGSRWFHPSHRDFLDAFVKAEE